jgi:GT2 family glycosyltransferase
MRPKIVLLGMLSKIPVPGVSWLIGQYATGFERLGFDVYYVEAHARMPSMFMTRPDDDGTARAASYIDATLRRFGLGDRWAYHALHDDGRCLGMSSERLRDLYRDAALIINMHGGTEPLEEHASGGPLVYLGTDPVEVELEIHHDDRRAIQFLAAHDAFFTWGLNYGNPDCLLPWSSQFAFVPSPPPVVLDFWDNDRVPVGAPLTTIGNWRQHYREVRFEGSAYAWSKHQEFARILDLPGRVSTHLELALASIEDEDRRLLGRHGWGVRPALEVAGTVDSYHDFIVASAGELSVAKEQNVHFRSGWFSERSAMYLAAGRPVVMQDTGFGAALPTGSGLLAFADLDGAVAAVESLQYDGALHRRGAHDIAREYLDYEVVLGDLLAHVGLGVPRRRGALALPANLSLRAASRRPLVLDPATDAAALRRPVPAAAGGPPRASIVVAVLDNHACTRLALESVLGDDVDLIVVDNGSDAPTRDYLQVLASRNRHVRLLRNEQNTGFAAACNQGIAAATSERLVLLNNDTVVTPGWLDALLAALDDDAVGIAVPATNRGGGGAQVPTDYTSYGGLLAFAAERGAARAGDPLLDVDVGVMFCAALRRDAYGTVGPLDERFGLGMFEDDDYSRRLHAAGLRTVCAPAAFVHHFGEATLGRLAANGSRSALFDANRALFEAKWNVTWQPHAQSLNPEYEALRVRVAAIVGCHVPAQATVLVISKGDERLIALDPIRAWHFPRQDDGSYSGHHPADDADAIARLEAMRERGATHLVVPATSRWWLEHYAGFHDHLSRNYRCAAAEPATAVIYELEGER